MPRTLQMIVLSLLLPSVALSQLVRVGGEVEIPIPDNWYLATDTLGFPIQLAFHNDSAEILLFRSVLAATDIVTNESDLKSSVDLVIEDVIETLPEGQLHTSTGFYETYRSGFVLEFSSADSAGGTALEHRLKGVIYRHPEGHQILFTIWGKCTRPDYPELKEAITLVQDGFVYRGPYEDSVFAPESMSYWPAILVGVALIGLLLLRPRRPKPDNRPGSNPGP